MTARSVVTFVALAYAGSSSAAPTIPAALATAKHLTLTVTKLKPGGSDKTTKSLDDQLEAQREISGS